MAIDRYIEAVQGGLRQLAETQQEPMREAAEVITEAIVDRRQVFSFGASHSFILTEEMVYRTGGLMLVNPIYPQGMNLMVRPLTMTSQIERLPDYGALLLRNSPVKAKDVLILSSTSGRNHVILDMALAAREMGVTTIGITALDYSREVASRHPSGKRLFELVDVVIDTCSPKGDAAVEFEGFAQKSGPLSTVLGCTVVNALICQVIQNLLDRGETPPVFISANLDGGDEHNARLLEENRDRIHYL
ncbi:SIS domain-containing protein [bacterium]|nr:SIS domain-containing protein [bacterium]